MLAHWRQTIKKFPFSFFEWNSFILIKRNVQIQISIYTSLWSIHPLLPKNNFVHPWFLWKNIKKKEKISSTVRTKWFPKCFLLVQWPSYMTLTCSLYGIILHFLLIWSAWTQNLAPPKAIFRILVFFFSFLITQVFLKR